MFKQIGSGPVIAVDWATAIHHDPILSHVAHAVLSGCWRELPSVSEYAPYVSCASKLSLAQGCMMWGMTVVIPASLRQCCLNELHKAHVDVVKMKSLAQSLLWWPRLDAAIEWMVKACDLCQTDADNPSRVSLLRSPANRTW